MGGEAHTIGSGFNSAQDPHCRTGSTLVCLDMWRTEADLSNRDIRETGRGLNFSLTRPPPYASDNMSALGKIALLLTSKANQAYAGQISTNVWKYLCANETAIKNELGILPKGYILV